jgi:hypothetical protein
MMQSELLSGKCKKKVNDIEFKFGMLSSVESYRILGSRKDSLKPLQRQYYNVERSKQKA